MPSKEEVAKARKKAEGSGILKYTKDIEEAAKMPPYASGTGPESQTGSKKKKSMK